MEQLTSEVVAMMHEAVKHASTGKGDPEILRRVREEAVKIREEVLKKHGAEKGGRVIRRRQPHLCLGRFSTRNTSAPCRRGHQLQLWQTFDEG